MPPSKQVCILRNKETNFKLYSNFNLQHAEKDPELANSQEARNEEDRFLNNG